MELFNSYATVTLHRLLPLGLALGLLAGCVSTQEVVNRLSPQFVGTNFDSFVLRYGPPKSKFILNSADIVYVWNSGTASVGIPASATTTGSGNTATTQFHGGGSIDMFCEIQFVTSPNGTIKELSILKDTIGFWTTSRCNEVFEKQK